jgi:hypothetical protein
MSITNPAECDVHSVIRFLNVKNIRPTEVHRQFVEVYVEGVINEGNARGVVRLMGGQMCAMKRDLDARPVE